MSVLMKVTWIILHKADSTANFFVDLPASIANSPHTILSLPIVF